MNNDFERILVIAAHPDDELLGCGGLLSKFSKQNVPIRIVFLAEGVSSRFSEINSNLEKIKNEIDIREKCSLRALEKIGINKSQIFFSKRKCCQLDQYPRLELTKEIEFHINDFYPTCLLTHFEKDTNIDHRICYEAILPAIRPLKNINLKIILSFEIPSSTEWNYPYQFKPNFFVDITYELESKLEACIEYKGEIKEKEDARSLESIKSLAFIRGNQSGYKYAEGFQLIVKR
tara:strand:- start:394 stop:1092 length:699 start_codon:yes stop_codon:yes gene_type:complete